MCNDADAAKSGVTAENVAAGIKSGQLTVQEAQQILGVEKNATLDQVRKVSHDISDRHVSRCALQADLLLVSPA